MGTDNSAPSPSRGACSDGDLRDGEAGFAQQGVVGVTPAEAHAALDRWKCNEVVLSSDFIAACLVATGDWEMSFDDRKETGRLIIQQLIKNERRMTVKELSTATGCTKNSIRNALDRLHLKGAVSKIMTNDNMAQPNYCYEVTEAGRTGKKKVVEKSGLNDIDRSRQVFTTSGPSSIKITAEDVARTNRESVMTRPAYDPPKWQPARPGATDHQKFQSRGFG